MKIQIQVVQEIDVQVERFVQSDRMEDIVVVYLVMIIAQLVIFVSFFSSFFSFFL